MTRMRRLKLSALVAFLLVSVFCCRTIGAQDHPAGIVVNPAQIYTYQFTGTTFTGVVPVLQLNAPIGMVGTFAKPACHGCAVGGYYGQEGPDAVLEQEMFAFHVDAPGATVTGPGGTGPPNGMDQCQGPVFSVNGSTESESNYGGIFTETWVPFGLGYATAGGLDAYFVYSTPGLKKVTYTAYLCTPQGAETGTLAAKRDVYFNVGAGLFDPIPDLVANNSVLPAASGGTPVGGVAADGVTEVLIRIPVQSQTADQFTLTVLNDQGNSSTSPDQDGALGNTGDTQFSQNTVTVTAQSTGGSYYAFAVYRAPTDFARQTPSGGYMPGTCGTVNGNDDQLACRSVSIQIQDITNPSNQTLPVTIVRPTVALVHGLWGSWENWDHFSPLVTNRTTVDPRFSVLRVNFDNPIPGSIIAEQPAAPQLTPGGMLPGSQQVFGNPRGNSLGFAYNAPIVLRQVQKWLEQFKSGQNPSGLPVAAVQADFVGHSMGGLLSRWLPLLPNFLNTQNFSQGIIHNW